MKSNTQPECGCPASPPGASITPSNVTNSVTVTLLMPPRLEHEPKLISQRADRQPDVGRLGDLALRDRLVVDADLGRAGDGGFDDVALDELACQAPLEEAGAPVDAADVANRTL